LRREVWKCRNRKTELRRIVALADYFLSINDNFSFEHSQRDHTIEFYSQLNNLVKRNYIRQHKQRRNGEEEIHYSSLIDYDSIEEVAESVDIRLFEYLYRDYGR
jgi:hypothetical protein